MCSDLFTLIACLQESSTSPSKLSP